MNQLLKAIGIALIIVFLAYHVIIFILAFGGCPPAYDVIQFTDLSEPHWFPVNNITHVTDQDLESRPYLREAFEEGKWVLLPQFSVFDFIPGNFFGPEYAVHRAPFWDREFLIGNYMNETIWEYNGTYNRFIAFAC